MFKINTLHKSNRTLPKNLLHSCEGSTIKRHRMYVHKWSWWTCVLSTLEAPGRCVSTAYRSPAASRRKVPRSLPVTCDLPSHIWTTELNLSLCGKFRWFFDRSLHQVMELRIRKEHVFACLSCSGSDLWCVCVFSMRRVIITRTF